MYAPADSYRIPGAGGLAPAAASAAGAAHFRQLPVPAEMAARGHPGQRTACHRGGGAPCRGRRHRRRVGPARGQSPYPAGGLSPGHPVGGRGPAGAEQACGHRHPPGSPDGGDRHRGRGRGASTASTAWTGAPPGSWWWPKPDMSTGCAWSCSTPEASAGPIWRCAAACPARRRGPSTCPSAGSRTPCCGGGWTRRVWRPTRTMRPCGRGRTGPCCG